MKEDLEKLDALLVLLRQHGVAEYSGPLGLADVRLVMGTAPVARVEAVKEEPALVKRGPDGLTPDEADLAYASVRG